MSLQDRLADDLKRAMKARDAFRVSVVRMVRTAVKNAEIEKRRPLTDDEIIGVLQRERKLRRESLQAAQQAGRTDLAAEAQRELAILEEYLPEELSDEELRRMAQEAIQEVGASGKSDMGKVMAVLMPKVRGRADGSRVSEWVRQLLES
ncbi:MAG: GatB/YqeY domain-containing protein [Alicyclobacillaceae bacterium]|nr:GatB/YqeY domain-containing protein [Alicyclobacillaceae bacterium]